MQDERRAQLQYARALLRRGRYGEILRRAAAVLREEVGRLLGRSEEQTYRRWLEEQEADTALRWQPPPGVEPPLVSLLMPPGATPRRTFTTMHLERQSWRKWELVAPGELPQMARAARGQFLALVLPGDALLPRALERALAALYAHPEAPFVYTDEGLLDAGGRALRPRFKPAWSPELLLSLPYTGQLTLFRREAIERVGGFQPGLLPLCALYDLTLKASELAAPVHLPELLYQRRLPPPSPATRQWAEVVQAALGRRSVDGVAEPGPAGPTSVAVRRKLPSRPRVAIIVPFRNRVDLLERCVESVRTRSTWDRWELLAVDNGSDDPATLRYLEELVKLPQVRLLRYPERFNFAAINNFAAAHTDAEMLLLLNNDTEVLTRDWIEALLEHALRPEVGIVGARLLYPDGSLQHAGVVLGIGGLAGHPFDGWPDGGAGAAEAPGHGGEVLAVREVSAVTAACAMIRRELYLEVGGMDAERFAVSFNDVDLCLRLRAAGYRIIYTPHAELIHHTSQTRTRESNLAEDEALRQRWGARLDDDPFYSPHLSRRVAYRPRFCERIL
jgi:GT2 family glycosyltransferase